MRSTVRDGGPGRSKVHRWRQTWETMMEGYLPGRDELLATGLDIAERALGRPPASVLDLGGGPGTTAEAVLRRWPHAAVTVLDADPVLLALAEAALPQVTVRQADLRNPAWRTAAEGPHDLVLLVMTLHYLPEERARRLYAEIRNLLRPGGTLLVADNMPTRSQHRQARSLQRQARSLQRQARSLQQQADPDPGGTWSRWWQELLGDPGMARLADRLVVGSSGMASADFVAGVPWHEEAARAAGFATCRTVWRRGHQAVLAAGVAMG